MKKALLFGCALALLAGCAQVSSDDYRKEHGQYGRTDGIVQNTSTNGLEAFVNGYRLNAVTKAVLEDFSEYGDGDKWCMQSDHTGCSAIDTETNLIGLPSGNVMACNMFIGQTVDGGVDMDAGSLDIAGDQTENDGLECAWGTHGATGGAFFVGTDPAFYTCGTFAFADSSGSDDFHFGFRVIHDGDTDYGFNKVWDDYHDFATIGFSGADASNSIDISNSAADTLAEVDTTLDWTDTATKTLCVYVSGAGVTTYTVDGLPPPTTTTYTFTDAEAIIPMFHILQGANLTGEVDLTKWEVGYATAPF